MAEDEQPPAHAEALAALVYVRYERLVGYARKQLRSFGVPTSSADPQDVVQIALVNVLAHAEPIERLRPYLYTVIKNEVGRAVRSYRTGQGYGSLDRDLKLESAGPTVDPCAAVDLRLDFQNAVRALPPQQRRVVQYRTQGYTQAETAAAMGAAPGTVAAHTSRALSMLKLTLSALSAVVAGSAAAWLWGYGLSRVSPGSDGQTHLPWQAQGAVAIAFLSAVGAVGAAFFAIWEVMALRRKSYPWVPVSERPEASRLTREAEAFGPNVPLSNQEPNALPSSLSAMVQNHMNG
ncbi:sigma-70 family RNA polymerase sigma factor (plasmid) [Streptomyces longwoodensis]|uniref:sigma-70 family RNA polymerase sigma factor n=1 Tax=Streptomyces longwoodensis TaxID=68231 RepID=UPI002ECFDDD5|nr:sigma-70 family RNA polymerase sigma factor [Streptomyces longwoodensis]